MSFIEETDIKLSENSVVDSDDDWMQLLFDIANISDNDSDVENLMNDVKKYDSTHIDTYFSIPNIDLESDIILDSKHDSLICTKCNKPFSTDNHISFCKKCGIETDSLSNHTPSFVSDTDHNTSNNSFMTFNFIGKNSYRYQRSYLKTCSNYASFRKNNNRKDMYNYNYQYEGKKLPKSSIKVAIELFSKIKEHNYVYRGNGKKGVLGACLFYACIINKITKTPREIASLMNIEERFLSHGDRILQELNEIDVISIPTCIRPLNDYLSQYFPTLNIPDKYKSFIVDIINRAEAKNIHINNDSKMTTKAIGSIYLLVMNVKDLNRITKDTIVKECNISKSTFIRYYNLLLSNIPIIKPVFKKHKITMPSKWRTKPTRHEILELLLDKICVKPLINIIYNYI